jgi:hypothetical protein
VILERLMIVFSWSGVGIYPEYGVLWTLDGIADGMK